MHSIAHWAKKDAIPFASSTTERKIDTGWKPWSLRSAILLPLTIVTVAILTLISILQRKNSRDDGIFLTDEFNNLSTTTNFLYNYLPTVIAVLYSSTWGWIDLDVKRLEPWFQLSRKQGATAETSLLLKYSAEFLPLVPITATRRRHWLVALVSAVLLLISWGITPLQSGIFSTSTIQRSLSRVVMTSNSLLPVSKSMTARFLMTSYGIAWLGQSLPPFTTLGFAVQPYKSLHSTVLTIGSNGSLTYSTTKYYSQFECRPASIVNQSSFGQISFDSGDGCVAKDLFSIQTSKSTNKTFDAYFVGHVPDPVFDYSLDEAECPSKSTFIAVWMRMPAILESFNNVTDIGAVFCNTSYYSQPSNITVTIPDGVITMDAPSGPAVPVSAAELNSSEFEYIIQNGYIPDLFVGQDLQSDPKKRVEVSDGTFLYHDAHLLNMSLLQPVSNMVGFAVGFSHLEPAAYLNSSLLAEAFSSAHTALFAQMIPSMLAPVNQNGMLQNATLHSQMAAVVMVPIFTVLVQILLAVVAIFTAAFWIISLKRTSNLTSDPASISKIIQMVGDSQILHLFQLHGTSNTKTLQKNLSGHQFVLEIETDRPALRTQQDKNLETSIQSTSIRQRTIPEPGTMHGRLGGEDPKELSWGAFSGFTLLLILGTVACFVLFFQCKKTNGLPLPSSNLFVQQLVISYIPTAYATIMEPFWVLLIRLASVLQPFWELHRRPSSSRTSLGLTYASLPPQIISFRAIRNGHFTLAALGISGIVASILTVALSGLFFLEDTSMRAPLNVTLIARPSFSSTGSSNNTDTSTLQADPYYVAMSNISFGTSLPPWVTTHGFFMPVSFPNTANDIDSEYQFEDMMVQASLDCVPLSNIGGTQDYRFDIAVSGAGANFSSHYLQSDGTEVTCISSSQYRTIAGDWEFEFWGSPEGSRSLEIFTGLEALDATDNTSVEFCSNKVVAGWLRANTTLQPTTETSSSTSISNFRNITSMSTSSTFISCQPRIMASKYSVLTSSSGHILNSTQVSSANGAFSEDVTNAMSLPIGQLLTLMTSLTEQSYSIWHKDDLASDWTNYLIKIVTGNSSFLEPSSPPPDSNAISASLSDVYSRIFAIQMSLISDRLTPVSPSSSNTTILATQIRTETRVFMSTPFFYITISILIFDMIVAINFYSNVPRGFLPRMPISVANIIAYFAGSHVFDDYGTFKSSNRSSTTIDVDNNDPIIDYDAEGTSGFFDAPGRRGGGAEQLFTPSHQPRSTSRDSSVEMGLLKQKEEKANRKRLYRYGKFIGTDGWLHIGIEKAPFVTPLEKED